MNKEPLMTMPDGAKKTNGCAVTDTRLVLIERWLAEIDASAETPVVVLRDAIPLAN